MATESVAASKPAPTPKASASPPPAAVSDSVANAANEPSNRALRFVFMALLLVVALSGGGYVAWERSMEADAEAEHQESLRISRAYQRQEEVKKAADLQRQLDAARMERPDDNAISAGVIASPVLPGQPPAQAKVAAPKTFDRPIKREAVTTAPTSPSTTASKKTAEELRREIEEELRGVQRKY